MPLKTTPVATKSALMPSVITSIATLLVPSFVGTFRVLVCSFPDSDGSIDISSQFKLVKLLLINVSAGTIQNDTLGRWVLEATLYVKLMFEMAAL